MKYVPISTAAKELGVTTRTIYYWDKKNVVKIKKDNNFYRNVISVKDLEKMKNSYSRNDVAEMLDVSVATISSWTKKGLIKRIRGVNRFEKQSVDELIRKMKCGEFNKYQTQREKGDGINKS